MGRKRRPVTAAITSGLRRPGRIELIGRAPWLLVDFAHTEASAAALAEVLRSIPRTRTQLVVQ